MDQDHELLPCVTIEPEQAAGAAVIWLHGLGADGHDFEPIVPQLKLPRTFPLRFVFPHAPHRPVTINNGMVMRAWYDIADPGQRRWQEDEAGIRSSEADLCRLIAREIDRGIPSRRIVLAGFSQGGAIVLQTGLRYLEPLGGIIALSTYLPLAASLPEEAHPSNRAIPILMAHGRQDTIIPYTLARHSRDLLLAAGYGVEWHAYDIGHSVSMEEIDTLSAWFGKRFTAGQPGDTGAV